MGSMEVMDGILGGVLALGAFMILLAIAAAICIIVGQWKVLKRAGKGGWEALIPFYNNVTLCNITGISPWWVLITFLAGILLNIIPVLGQFASAALSIYFAIILNLSVARSFGKSDAFAIGLILVPPIFWLMLAFQDNKYLGAKPVNDPVWNFIDEKIIKSANNNDDNKKN